MAAHHTCPLQLLIHRPFINILHVPGWSNITSISARENAVISREDGQEMEGSSFMQIIQNANMHIATYIHIYHICQVLMVWSGMPHTSYMGDVSLNSTNLPPRNMLRKHWTHFFFFLLHNGRNRPIKLNASSAKDCCNQYCRFSGQHYY